MAIFIIDVLDMEWLQLYVPFEEFAKNFEEKNVVLLEVITTHKNMMHRKAKCKYMSHEKT